MQPPAILIFPIVTFLIVTLGTRLLIHVLKRHAILDRPNDRSSHDTPTPRGAGIAVMGGLFSVWIATAQYYGESGTSVLYVAGIGFILCGVSWIDDIRNISPLFRLIVHFAAVSSVMIVAPFPGPVFGGFLPYWADFAITVVIWVWFMNLFNFMDGIDGLAGIQALAIGVGIFVLVRKLGFGELIMVLGLTVAAAAGGFLRWNWHPAKIFLGDVGSIPLGFAIGWLLLLLAANGAWASALILPMYFFADATLTLMRRVIRGEQLWKAHREHFYQRAVTSGLRHDQVVWTIAIANIFLIMLAIVAARGLPQAAVLGAVGAVSMLVFLLAKGGPTDS